MGIVATHRHSPPQRLVRMVDVCACKNNKQRYRKRNVNLQLLVGLLSAGVWGMLRGPGGILRAFGACPSPTTVPSIARR